MNVFSKQETLSWCQAHHVALGHDGLPEKFDADFKFEIPVDAGRRVALVNRAMQAFADEPVLLVWFTEWGVWTSGQRMHVFDRFRLSYGETRRLMDSPGHLFERTEMEDTISFVTIGVLFLWDCHIVVPQRRKLLHFSHDEFGLAKGVEFGNSGQSSSVAH